MPKARATVEVVSISPSTDGNARVGDTVTFTISPPDAGTISLVGRDESGDVLWGSGLTRGTMSVPIGWSYSWQNNPVPLECQVMLRATIGGRVRTIAETEFPMLPEEI